MRPIWPKLACLDQKTWHLTHLSLASNKEASLKRVWCCCQIISNEQIQLFRSDCKKFNSLKAILLTSIKCKWHFKWLNVINDQRWNVYTYIFSMIHRKNISWIISTLSFWSVIFHCEFEQTYFFGRAVWFRPTRTLEMTHFQKETM